MSNDDLARRLAKARGNTAPQVSIPGDCNCAQCQFIFKACVFNSAGRAGDFQVASRIPEDTRLAAPEFFCYMDARASV
jgi:hypothetical protein